MNGADINRRDAQGETPLFTFCNNKMSIVEHDDDLTILHLLMEHGADAMIGNMYGETVLDECNETWMTVINEYLAGPPVKGVHENI